MSGTATKVLVAMSGGVDSSVAAALLQKRGFEVVGCFMRLGSPGDSFNELEPVEDAAGRRDVGAAACRNGENGSAEKLRIGHQGCCSINDAADARLVAAKLGIPLYVCNFKKDFGRIIDYFVNEYNGGRTPNPCVRCNDWLKFGKLHDYARQMDAKFVASGHYARIDRSDPQNPRLLRGLDARKDQSYVLFGASRDRLHEMLLPIGEYRKSEVRAIAQRLDLPVFNKPDSQEICFVPDNDYAGVVQRHAPGRMQAGDLVDASGKIVGRHEGHQHYTIGQRRGIGLALGHPIYVVHKDPGTNTVVVGEKDALFAGGCIARDVNWIALSRDPKRSAAKRGEGDWINCTAKIRSNAEPMPARVRALEDNADTKPRESIPAGSVKDASQSSLASGDARQAIEVRFDDPQFAVAPGQAVVCYDGDEVMCGGWIERAIP